MIGNYQISIALPTPTTPASKSQIRFNPVTNRPDVRVTQPPVGQSRLIYPRYFQQQQIDPQAIHATGLTVEEIDYCTIGED